jgi:hypothetical protein
MNRPEPLDQLSSFYQALDSIPTPPLAIKPPSRWGLLSLVLAPICSTLFVYGFVMFCASGPVDPNSGVPLELAIDRSAMAEIKAAAISQPPRAHVFKRASRRELA